MQQGEADEKIKNIKRQEEEESAKTAATNLGLSYANLSSLPIDTEALVLVNETVARNASLAVIAKKDTHLSIAVDKNPEDKAIQAILKKLHDQGYTWSIIFVSKYSLANAFDRYKNIPKHNKVDISGRVYISKEVIVDLRERIKELKDVNIVIDSLGIGEASRIVEIIVASSLNLDASDIHIEPKEKDAILRYRLDGVLYDASSVSPKIYSQLLKRFKLLAGMTLNIHDVAQDGRFTIDYENTEIEVRVSIIPSNYGESLVMRILNPKAISLSLEDMGFREDIYPLLESEIKKPHGIIITTGPTGSGKTTTLYAFLKKLSSPEIKIITLEDPIEYHLPGIVQTQIKPNRSHYYSEASSEELRRNNNVVTEEYTFASGLRAILRQDPDVILIGEIRDAETADIAVQSAQTGHLVFSTLHTNDAAGALSRFFVLKVQPSIVADAINLILAQRLVRKLCPTCKKAVSPTEEQLTTIKKELQAIPRNIKYPDIDKNLKIYEAVGCGNCRGTGYKGRTGIIEALIVNEAMGKLISQNATHSQIVDLAKEQGTVTLYQDGLLKIVNGITSLKELESVATAEEE